MYVYIPRTNDKHLKWRSEGSRVVCVSVTSRNARGIFRASRCMAGSWYVRVIILKTRSESRGRKMWKSGIGKSFEISERLRKIKRGKFLIMREKFLYRSYRELKIFKMY